MGITAAAVIPEIRNTIERARVTAAARFLAGRLALARTQAAARGAAVALRFERDERGVFFTVHADGNHNGVRSAEITLGVDAALEHPMRFDDTFPGVSFSLADEADADDGLPIGRAALVSFSPNGTATSGTLYLGGRGLRLAVRVLGATGRTRILHYDDDSREWRDGL